MRQKIQHTGCHPQPGSPVVVGEFSALEAGDRVLSADFDSATQDFVDEASGSDARACSDARSERGFGQRICRLPARVLILMIRGYQLTISPWLPMCCRFTPTCSQYAIEALRLHGFFKGSLLTVWRVLRCQPFCRGGHDPVPPRRHRNKVF